MSPRPTEPPTDAAPHGAEPVRLQKFLASCGLGSRRACEDLVRDGRVSVDGVTVTELGTRVDPATADVRVDGERLKPQSKRYFLLNKPEGVLCTNRDPEGRRRAVDLVPAGETQLFTVGRLDEGSEGLLIVTNDGELAQKLAHPRFRTPRRYLVHVAGVPTDETLRELESGLKFAGGRFKLSRSKRLRTQGRSTHLEVELHEGRNREIRRLFARVGHKVLKLRRITFGPLALGDQPVGTARPLTRGEIDELRKWAAGFRPEEKPSTSPRPPKRSKRKVTSPRRVGVSRPPAGAKPRRKSGGKIGSKAQGGTR